MNDKMRAEFEAALSEHMPHADLSFDGENYSSAWANAAWWGWQASRAALLVELPERIDEETGYVEGDEYYNLAIDRCQQAIEATGVRVKP